MRHFPTAAPPPIDSFRSIPAGAALMTGDRRDAEAGLALFRKRRVGSIRWAEGGAEATLPKERARVLLLPEPESATIRHRCDCGRWRTEGSCPHVAAAALALYYAIDGRTFGVPDPSPEYRAELGSGLEIAPPEPSPIARADEGWVLARLPGGLSARALGPASARALAGALPVAGRDASGAWVIGETPSAGRVAGWAAAAESAGWGLAWDCADGRGRVPVRAAAPLAARAVIHADIGEDGAVEVGARAECGASRLAVVAEVRPLLLLAADGRLAEIPEDPSRGWARQMVPAEWWAGATRRVQAEGFNAIAVARAPLWRSGPPPVELRHLGRAAEPPAWHPAEPEITLDLAPPQRGLVAARLMARWAGLPVPADAAVNRVEAFFASEAGEPGLIAGAAGRAKVLAGAMRDLLELPAGGEPGPAIDAAAGAWAVRSSGRSEGAARFLRAFWEEFAASGAAIPVAAPAGPRPWALVAPPSRQLARMVLAMPWGEPPGARKRPCHWWIRRRHEREFLGDAAAACAPAGAGIRRRGQPVRRVDAALRIDVDPGRGEDWFDVGFALSCGGEDLPEDRIRQIARGAHIVGGEDSYCIPGVPAEAASAALGLCSAAPARRRGRRPGPTRQVSRIGLLTVLASGSPGIEVGRAPEGLLATARELRDFRRVPEIAPPAALRASLRPYQISGFRWLAFLHRHRLGACLADDMGLGKSVQTIALLALARESWAEPSPRHLIVAPASLICHWAEEIGRFCPSLSVAAHLGPSRDWAASRRADVVVTTYDTLRNDARAIGATDIDVLVLDEAQAIKNPGTGRAEAVAGLRRRFTLCLTGTPLENSAMEYQAIMDTAVPGIFGERDWFRAALASGDASPLGRARPFILRRTRAEVLPELPALEEADVHLDMSPAQARAYARVLAQARREVLAAYDSRPAAQAGFMALVALTRMRQICVSPRLIGEPHDPDCPKIARAVEVAEEVAAGGAAILVFSQFTGALDIIGAALQARGIGFLRLDGSTPARRRGRLVEGFQDPGGPPVFLISLKAGGAGLNLTRASYVLHVDPWWNPAVEDQATARCHRIGQSRAVLATRLIMRGTVEERMMALKERKRELFEQIVGATEGRGATAGSALSREDFEFLIG